MTMKPHAQQLDESANLMKLMRMRMYVMVDADAVLVCVDYDDLNNDDVMQVNFYAVKQSMLPAAFVVIGMDSYFFSFTLVQK